MSGSFKQLRSRGTVLALILIGALLLMASQLHAQPAPTPSPGVEVGGGVPTVVDLFMTSPVINGMLLGLSVLAVVMFIFFLLTFTARAFIPARFIDNVTRLVLAGQFDQAINLCQNHPDAFASSIIQRTIENRDKGHGVLIDILQAEGQRRASVIWNRIGYLAEIVAIAPMLGLTGTVLGMMKVFFTLDTRTVGLKSLMLSQGIAEAMATTLFGLAVAIAAAVFYMIVKGRATNILADTEAVCHTVADHTHEAAARRGEVEAAS